MIGYPKGLSYDERYGRKKSSLIRLKQSRSQRKRFASMTEEQKKERFPPTGRYTPPSNPEIWKQNLRNSWTDQKRELFRKHAKEQKFGKHNLPRKHRQETKDKISATMKAKGISGVVKWTSERNPMNDPIKRIEIIAAAIKASHIRPSGLEKKFQTFIDTYHLPLFYTGDGKIIIGSRNPDFVNFENRVVVEVAHKEHKELHTKSTWRNYEIQSIFHYRKSNWRCVVVWEDATDKQILQSLAKVGLNHRFVEDPIALPVMRVY